MKENILISIFVVTFLLVGSVPPTLAVKGPPGVAKGVHNLSISGPTVDFGFGPEPTPYLSDNETEICIFCHTPHGGTLIAPLWNHSLASSTFNHYNTVVLTTEMAPAIADNRALGTETLVCMGCHDGTVSVYTLHNLNNTTGQPINALTWTSDTKIPALVQTRIGGSAGGDLSDDHPVSFSYDDLKATATYTSGGPKEASLRPLVQAESLGVKFFGATNRVECTTCHDPHVDYSATGNPLYTPFLITPNDGSKLCLACHNK